jgi:hypothetical protein
VAEKDFEIVHGRFSGMGLPVNWIAGDIVRVKDGALVEHWDVIEDEATREQSKSGLPMFGMCSRSELCGKRTVRVGWDRWPIESAVPTSPT